MKKRELFTGRVNETNMDDGRRLSREVILRKGKKHWIDSQGVMYHLETGAVINMEDERPPEYRPKLNLRGIEPLVDSGLRGSMLFLPFTHNVQARWINKVTGRWNTQWIHVRLNKMHVVDKYGRRYNKKTGDCLDDASLFIDVRTAKVWEPIYGQAGTLDA